MVAVLQILFVLVLISLVIALVFKPRRAAIFALPDDYKEILSAYVPFYTQLDAEGKNRFADRVQRFLSAVKIAGANAEVEDLDRLLIGSAAIIPVYHIPDWEYINLREVLLYPGHFTTDFEQQGHDRMVSGMVGNGPLQNVMILTKWELRQCFLDPQTTRNTAIHEFIHLIDKMDGTLDGVPEILLPKKWVPQWKNLLSQTAQDIRQGNSDIDHYAATSDVECFAVVAEYFFQQPHLFKSRHPALAEMLKRIFIREKE